MIFQLLVLPLLASAQVPVDVAAAVEREAAEAAVAEVEADRARFALPAGVTLSLTKPFACGPRGSAEWLCRGGFDRQLIGGVPVEFTGLDVNLLGARGALKIVSVSKARLLHPAPAPFPAPVLTLAAAGATQIGRSLPCRSTGTGMPMAGGPPLCPVTAAEIEAAGELVIFAGYSLDLEPRLAWMTRVMKNGNLWLIYVDAETGVELFTVEAWRFRRK